jgi:hypothetical protein
MHRKLMANPLEFDVEATSDWLSGLRNEEKDDFSRLHPSYD